MRVFHVKQRADPVASRPPPDRSARHRVVARPRSGCRRPGRCSRPARSGARRRGRRPSGAPGSAHPAARSRKASSPPCCPTGSRRRRTCPRCRGHAGRGAPCGWGWPGTWTSHVSELAQGVDQVLLVLRRRAEQLDGRVVVAGRGDLGDAAQLRLLLREGDLVLEQTDRGGDLTEEREGAVLELLTGVTALQVLGAAPLDEVGRSGLSCPAWTVLDIQPS